MTESRESPVDFAQPPSGKIDWRRVSMERGAYSRALRRADADPDPVAVG